MHQLKRIPKRSLSRAAYERLKALILRGDVGRGDPLVIDDLAHRLGISRTPVREAVLLLAQEGLVVSIPNRGTFVAQIDRKEVLDTYEVRCVLEPLGVRTATPRIPEEELNDIASRARTILGEVEERKDRRLYTEFDVAFHRLAVRHCENEVLKRILLQLIEKLYRVQVYAGGLPSEHIHASLQEHSAILAAMMKRDAAAAARHMAEHLQRATERVSRFLSSNFAPGADHKPPEPVRARKALI